MSLPVGIRKSGNISFQTGIVPLSRPFRVDEPKEEAVEDQILEFLSNRTGSKKSPVDGDRFCLAIGGSTRKQIETARVHVAEGLQGVGGQLDVSRLPPIACIEHDLARTAAAANVKAFLPVFEWQHVSDERPWIHDAIGEQRQRPIPRGWPLAE